MNKTVVDLFCGAGGLSEGFKREGYNIVLGVDLDKDSIATFKSNNANANVFLGDIKDVSNNGLKKLAGVGEKELTCLVGGPPCQGFSKNRARRHIAGKFIEDPRNYLFKEFMRAVECFMPSWVVIENVPEILIKNNGLYGYQIFDLFKDLGYNCESRILNAINYGVPQLRKRAFFVASRSSKRIQFPPITHSENPKETLLKTPLTIWDAISDIPPKTVSDISDACNYLTPPQNDYQKILRKNSTKIFNHFSGKLTDRQLERVKLLREGEGMEKLPDHLKPKSGYGSAYRRMNSKKPALTLTTWLFHPGSGMFTHPFENRVISIREAARIQSFRDSFVFSGSRTSQYRQIGNAVPPFLSAALARQIKNTS